MKDEYDNEEYEDEEQEQDFGEVEMDEEEEYDNDKFKKFAQIAKQDNTMKVKAVNNAHHDFEIDPNQPLEDSNDDDQSRKNQQKGIGVHHAHNVDKLNYDNDERSFNSLKSHKSKDASEEEGDNYEYTNKVMDEQAASSNKYLKLPRFDTSEFKNVNLSNEYKELLSIMAKFTPEEIQLDSKLKPFIPSYIPAVGEVDAFLKMGRPDNLQEELGLAVLDEPTISGIDPSIFSLELSYKLKSKSASNFIVKSVENAEKNPLKIQNWVDQISNLHKEKMASDVTYTKKMPDVESLMQIWPEMMESTFKDIPFPNENLNIGLDNYSKIVCNMLDIPVHADSNKAIIQALHVFFTLYSEFRENVHFQRKKEKGEEDVQSMKFY